MSLTNSNFPLRWESTGDKWWYACPIDYAAANGHYDLVRELIRLDGNHLIKLTSLRRVRRLEVVWDDEQQFQESANCRCKVAHQLFDEFQTQNNEKNPLIVGGYGGWLLYTAASSGNLGFVQEILGKYPLLVFGEGEYGVTDILYAAARSKNHEVFRVIYDFALFPRFLNEGEEKVEEMGLGFKWEIRNRGVHAAARGGNLIALKDLLVDCSCDDVMEYRDVNGSTILHAAAAKGQVEVVKHLVESYGMITSVDSEGNTPLHVAAYKGQLSILSLLQASPLSGSVVNKAGNTFLHMVISGFQTPAFRRLDRQIELMKQLANTRSFNIEDIINSQNNEGRTALHLAIIGNIHSDLVKLLMSARYIDVNVRDDHGITPLGYLKQQPRSSSSDMLIMQIISVGGVSSCKDDIVRKAFASHLKMQGIINSPGTSFRVPDNEIFLSTGIDHMLDSSPSQASVGHFCTLDELSHNDSTDEHNRAPDGMQFDNVKKSGPLDRAAKRLKTMWHWSFIRKKATNRSKTGQNSFSDKKWFTTEEIPVPLRESFSSPTSLPSNKRTLAVRSNVSSPTIRKRFASEVTHQVLEEQPCFDNLAHSPSNSLSKSSISTHTSPEQENEICMTDEIANSETPCSKQGSFNKVFVNTILCFSGSQLPIKDPVGKHSPKHPVLSADRANLREHIAGQTKPERFWVYNCRV